MHRISFFPSGYMVFNNRAWRLWILGIYFRMLLSLYFWYWAANSPKDDGGGLSLLGYSILESFKETSLWLFFLLYCDLILEL